MQSAMYFFFFNNLANFNKYYKFTYWFWFSYRIIISEFPSPHPWLSMMNIE